MLFRSAMFLIIMIAMFTFSTASAYTVQDVAGGGSISGKITFSGAAPEPTKFPIEKNPEVCGTGVREVQEVTVDGSGGLQHVVVFIKAIDAGKEWSAPGKRLGTQPGNMHFYPLGLCYSRQIRTDGKK